MDKITHSSKNITPFGGLNFIYQAMNRMGLGQFLDGQLGFRHVLAHYSYSDVVYSLFGNAFTQGSFVADLETLKEKYSQQVFNNIPSPDTVEYVCQELKTPNILIQTENAVCHTLNYNNKMNETLVALAVKTKQLSVAYTDYTLDYDNVIIENDKQDAQNTYQHSKGYQPGFAFVGRIPVHIENRNGNTPARYQQKETLERCFDNLSKHQIKIKNFRADAASYQEDVIALAEENTEHFYIRMLDFEGIRERCGEIDDWQTIEINYEKKEVASILYAPFGGGKKYRVVVTRKKRKDAQIDLLSASAYTYQGIITNDNADTEKGVIEFYNKRGDAENSNRYMLNDFNLHHLPFPDLSTNTVYIYLMAMCATLFEWTKTVLVKNKTKGITIAMRVKAVCFHYIAVATTFVKHAHQNTLKVFSAQEYVELQI
jgi:hypothetical protein